MNYPPAQVYLDHAATSPVSAALAQQLATDLLELGWNPSTPYTPGLEARKALEAARRSIAGQLGCPPERVIFTSGGTESNNIALNACRRRFRDGGIVWHSATTHPSLALPVAALPGEWTAHSMPRTAWGAVDTAGLHRLPSPQVVVTEWVNNEIGFVQPVDAIVDAARARNPEVCILLDGAQGLGKLPVPDLAGVSAFTASGHKVGAPVGIGILVIDTAFTPAPLALGGGQEGGWRPGTESAPLARALASALERMQAADRTAFDFPALDAHTHPVVRRDPAGTYSPWITLLDLAPVEGEVLLHHLEAEHLYLGAGSACSTHRKGLSAIHAAIGLTPRQSRCTLRWSTCPGQSLDAQHAAWTRLVLKWRELKPLFGNA